MLITGMACWYIFYNCEFQYKLDFRGLSPRGRNSPYRTDAEDQSGGAGMGDSKVGGGGSSDGSMWQFGMVMV